MTDIDKLDQSSAIPYVHHHQHLHNQCRHLVWEINCSNGRVAERLEICNTIPDWAYLLDAIFSSGASQDMQLSTVSHHELNTQDDHSQGTVVRNGKMGKFFLVSDFFGYRSVTYKPLRAKMVYLA